MQARFHLHSFAGGYLFSQHHGYWACPFHFVYLDILVNIPYIYTKNYFWVLCSVQLVSLSVFIAAPHHLDYLVIGVEIERLPSSFFQSFAVCSLNSSMAFTMFYSASTTIVMAVLIMNWLVYWPFVWLLKNLFWYSMFLL